MRNPSLSKKTFVLIALVALIVSTQSAFAAGPEERLATWLGSFQNFVEKNPQLPAREAKAIYHAIDFATPEMFSDSLSAEQRDLLTKRLAALEETLTCPAYSEIRYNLLGMESWMKANNVVMVAGDCYCTKVSATDLGTEFGDEVVVSVGDGCAAGWECDNTISCTSREGTTHNGRCRRVSQD